MGGEDQSNKLLTKNRQISLQEQNLLVRLQSFCKVIGSIFRQKGNSILRLLID